MSILGKTSVYGNIKHFGIIASSCLMSEDIMSTIFMMIDSLLEIQATFRTSIDTVSKLGNHATRDITI